MMRALILMLVLGSLEACMLTPTDEQTVCGADVVLTFSGYTLGPSQTVELQAAASATGTFTSFATATSGTSFFQVGDSKLYAWSVSTSVPGWAVRSSGYEVFVRGKIGQN